MPIQISSLFDKTFPSQLDMLCQMIDECYEEAKGLNLPVSWTKDKHFNEYGFYLKTVDKSHELFLGLWYDLWETKGLPLCITFSSTKAGMNSKLEKFNTYINKELINEGYHLNYENYLLLAFNKEYFENIDNYKPILKIFIDIQECLNFGHLILRRASSI